MFGFEAPARKRTAKPPAAPHFSDVDKQMLAGAYQAWARAANACPLCVVQVSQIPQLAGPLAELHRQLNHHSLAAHDAPDDSEMGTRLARECLRRAALQDAIAAVCDNANAGTAEYVRDELEAMGFDMAAVLSEGATRPQPSDS